MKAIDQRELFISQVLSLVAGLFSTRRVTARLQAAISSKDILLICVLTKRVDRGLVFAISQRAAAYLKPLTLKQQYKNKSNQRLQQNSDI